MKVPGRIVVALKQFLLLATVGAVLGFGGLAASRSSGADPSPESSADLRRMASPD